MRILHLVHQYPPEYIGGTELYTQALASHQVKLGHEVSIFYPSNDSGLFSVSREESVSVYRAPAGSRTRMRVFFDTFRSPDLVKDLENALDSERPDLVHIQHLMGLPVSLTSILKSRDLPIALTLHDYWYVCANGQLITNTDNTICTGPDRWYGNCGRCAAVRSGKPGLQIISPAISPLMAHRNRLLRSVLAQADLIIAPSRFVQQTYKQMGFRGDHMVIIPHGIDLPVDLESALRPRDKRSHAGLHIGYVGSLAWQKGVHNLIAAVNQLPEENVVLSIYGNLDAYPDYSTGLKNRARHPGIHFHGQVSRQDLWVRMAELDVLVLPTLWYEVSPLIIQEAFAARLPIIASRLGAMEEMIDHGKNGWLEPTGEVDALRARLQSLLDKPEQLSTAQAHIPRVRTISEHAGEIDRAYEMLMSES